MEATTFITGGGGSGGSASTTAHKLQRELTVHRATRRTQPGTYEVREETIGERSFWVVPAIMMTQGVRNGSHGAIYHRADHLAMSVPKWENIPVTIQHPRDGDGNFISANSTGVSAVGHVSGAFMSGDKLRGELWLDVQALTALSPTAAELINTRQPLEVSIGVFADYEQFVVNQQPVQMSVNYTPDHLAILIGEVGACSITDGCGIRVNSLQTNNENQMEILSILQMNGGEEPRHILTNLAAGQSLNQLLDNLYSVVNRWDSAAKYHFLDEVYSDHFVYRVRDRDHNGNSIGDAKHYKQTYTQDAATGVITLTGEPVLVVKRIEYIEINNNQINHKQGDKPMEKKPCCPDLINAIIQANTNGLTTEDQPWLAQMEPEQLEKLRPIAPEPQNNEAPATITDDAVTAYLEQRPAEEVLRVIPADLQSNIRTGLQLREERRDAMVQEIMTNAAPGTWTEAELKGMECGMLQKLSRSMIRPGNYSAAAPGEALQTNADDKTTPTPLLPPGVV